MVKILIYLIKVNFRLEEWQRVIEVIVFVEPHILLIVDAQSAALPTIVLC